MSESTQRPTPNPPDPDEARALAPAYAFGATDLVDDEVVRAAMARSAEVGEEVHAYRRLHTAMHFTADPVAPPAALEERLRAALLPPAAPIAQAYTGPGSQAAQGYALAANAVPTRNASTPPAEAERIGYWPSAPLPNRQEQSQTSPVAPHAAASGALPSAASAAAVRVNPLTGRPMPIPPAQAKGTAAAGYAPPASYAKQSAYASPAAAIAGTKTSSPQAAAGQRARSAPITTAKAGPRAAAPSVPADFVAFPEGEKRARRGTRTGVWLGWGAALVAVALLAGSNFLWYAREQQQTAASQTTLERLAQLENDVGAGQQEVTALQQSANAVATQSAADSAAATATLAATQTELAALQTQLSASQEALVAAQATATAEVAVSNAQAGSALSLSPGMLGALAQGALDDAMLGPINAASTMTATARMVWNAEMQSGMLMAMDMPPLPAGEAYQLWLLRGGVPTSAGMFTVDATGKGMLEVTGMPIDEYEVAAVTAEPMAGSPAPTGTILIAGEL